MKKRLITSALPYVNNIPHLGNLIQVLSADVFARFCRLRGYDTLYICGTDEYGTATETKAREEGISPKELCSRYFKVHDEIYTWFNISFDRFGRTSTEWHTKITQHIFLKLYENGYITEKTIQQLYSEESDMFLADRYVRGTCPHCGYEEARGDQCEDCGKLLDPSDLIDPRSILDNSAPVMKETRHLYIKLPEILPKLEDWMQEASVRGKWARNALQMTQAWIRDGLKERAITRDLKWGIPVPLEEFKNKVFYVWFDAPIGYISITANHTENWEAWWKNPEEVELFQFIGKDNIPFHTVIFPSSLLGSGEKWTLLHHMSSSEYLNYEDGKFSKSKGIGVFGDEVRDTGIPADVWRFYIFYNRPETSDYMFTWNDFLEKVNGELIGNLGNLVNRTLTFISRYFEGKVPASEYDGAFWKEVKRREDKITGLLEWAHLRDAFREIFALASYGNKVFQEAEPWKTRKENPDAAAGLLGDLANLIKDLSILTEPFIPDTAKKIAGLLGVSGLRWDDLARYRKIEHIRPPEILFEQLEREHIKSLQERFSGTQSERKEEKMIREKFSEQVELRVAKIVEVQKHPSADKLYIEKVDLGFEQRQIVSGLVPYYSEDELEGRNIILVSNLKPAKLRGEISEGMLLAAEADDTVEVLFMDQAEPGDRVITEGDEAEKKTEERLPEIDIDTFFSFPLSVQEYAVFAEGRPLLCRGKKIITGKVRKGKVG
jgi:methionyl-tRNA synthetase